MTAMILIGALEYSSERSHSMKKIVFLYIVSLAVELFYLTAFRFFSPCAFIMIITFDKSSKVKI